MIFSSPPPQFGQCCMSMSKTRLSSSAQLMRCGRTWTVSTSHSATESASVAGPTCSGGPCGTTSERSLAFGASTPWNLLSWHDTLEGAADPDDGRNVVIHEFAHRLDQDHGAANGAPRLGPGRGYDEWSRVLGAEFAALRERVAAAEAAGVPEPARLIPAYGATDPAEFFAVVSELFFERATALQAAHAALYGQLQLAYRTDPAGWQ